MKFKLIIRFILFLSRFYKRRQIKVDKKIPSNRYTCLVIMIISRTPYRLSFFGGGTDFPQWYSKNEGRVISSTINKYSYINVRYLPNYFKFKSVIRYFQRRSK